MSSNGIAARRNIPIAPLPLNGANGNNMNNIPRPVIPPAPVGDLNNLVFPDQNNNNRHPVGENLNDRRRRPMPLQIPQQGENANNANLVEDVVDDVPPAPVGNEQAFHFVNNDNNNANN